MNAREIGIRRIVVAGAIVGAAVGGTVTTLIKGNSGPMFWGGMAVGVIVGPICLVAVSGVFDLAQAFRRRSFRRM